MTAERTIFITGATDGLGRALADRLAADGARLILHGRDAAAPDRRRGPHRGHAGRTAAGDRPGRPRGSRPGAGLADEVRQSTDRLDVFVSNAGIGSGEPEGRERRTSADGYELRFAVNYLAGFLLTLELLPLLRASAPARIVNVASLGQHRSTSTTSCSNATTRQPGVRAEQARPDHVRLRARRSGAGAEVTVNSLHPATYMPTKMVLQDRVQRRRPRHRGHATWRLVADPALPAVTGRFFDRTQETRANPQAYVATARTELWRRSLALVDYPVVDTPDAP